MKLRTALLYLAVLAFALGTSAAEPKPDRAFAPTDSYRKMERAGFTLLLGKEMVQQTNLLAEVLTEIDRQLAVASSNLPPRAVEQLKKVSVWIEFAARPRGAAEYHTSAGWLRENGYNPDKLQAIEVNNARNFVQWSRQDQPAMLIHELAHAYHDRVLGWNEATIKSAFANARTNQLYEKVERRGGSMVRAYALTDHKEYFAELTEAYFSRNDFFPFNRGELKMYDSVGYTAVAAVWLKDR